MYYLDLHYDQLYITQGHLADVDIGACSLNKVDVRGFIGLRYIFSNILQKQKECVFNLGATHIHTNTYASFVLRKSLELVVFFLLFFQNMKLK